MGSCARCWTCATGLTSHPACSACPECDVEEDAMRYETKLIAVLVACLAGCASYDGRGLIAGKSTTAEIQATMGAPVERHSVGGESVWWYPRGPMGFHTYAVRVGADG